MSAQTVIHALAWVLGSAVVVLIASYWFFAPLLGWWNGERFKTQAKELADSEDAAWAEFRKEGKFPGVDESLMDKPGWVNALAVAPPKASPFAKKAEAGRG